MTVVSVGLTKGFAAIIDEVAEARELIIDGAKYLKVVKSPNRWSPPSECIEYEDGTYEWTEKSNGTI